MTEVEKKKARAALRKARNKALISGPLVTQESNIPKSPGKASGRKKRVSRIRKTASGESIGGRNNIFTKVDGILFQSKKEADRYLDLQIDPEVTDLETQPKFSLDVNGHHICKYNGDFRYKRNGIEIVEDVKSNYTATLRVFKLKKKMMLAIHNITVQEYNPQSRRKNKDLQK